MKKGFLTVFTAFSRDQVSEQAGALEGEMEHFSAASLIK